MPAYEYKCEECQEVFLNIETFSEHDRHESIECPKCGSDRVRRVIGVPHVHTAKKT